MEENENPLGYSDEWQRYAGDYSKHEFDIKLMNGQVIENCYPNAGKFTPFDTTKHYLESEVMEIRFSNNPRSWLNCGVSKMADEKFADDQTKENKPVFIKALGKNQIATPTHPNGPNGSLGAMAEQNYLAESEEITQLMKQMKFVPRGTPGPQVINEGPKIGRNDACPCGSGKKYKKCCAQ